VFAVWTVRGGTFNGDMSVSENSALTIRNASHTGDMFIGSGGVANLQAGMNQTGSINVDTGGHLNPDNAFQSGGNIHLNLNSSARFAESTTGFVEAATGSEFEIGQGQFGGAQISQSTGGRLLVDRHSLADYRCLVRAQLPNRSRGNGRQPGSKKGIDLFIIVDAVYGVEGK